MTMTMPGVRNDNGPPRPLIRRIGPPLLIGMIFGAALLALHGLVQTLDYQSTVDQIRAFGWGRISLGILLTFGSFAALIGYDRSALRYVRRQVPANSWRSPPFADTPWATCSASAR